MSYMVKHNDVLKCEEVIDLDLHFIVDLCETEEQANRLINNLEGRY